MSRLLIVAVLAAAMALPAEPAAAATTCSSSVGLLAVDLTARGDAATLSVADGGQILVSVAGQPIACSGAAATVTNTNFVVVASAPNTGAHDVVIAGAPRFAPGAGNDENGGDPELEIFVNLRGEADSRLSVFGSHMRVGADGINPNATRAERQPDADIFPDGMRNVTAIGGSGPDMFSARGGAGTGRALTDPITFIGGDGADRLVGGEAGDALHGGPGADTLDVRQGGRDTADCGPGADAAVADARTTDVLTACERLLLGTASRPSRRHQLILVSRAGGAGGRAGNRDSGLPAVSADGRYVAFTSTADNLTADRSVTPNVFVRDLVTDRTTLVSRAGGAAGAVGDHVSDEASISADGRYVAFVSDADNLSAEDDDTVMNVFVRDLRTNTTTLVSRATGGAAANGISAEPSISADGRYVAFDSAASNLGEDQNVMTDVFVRDLRTRTTTLVSGGDGASQTPSISGDGRFVAFRSWSDNLSDEDVAGVQDVFARDLRTKAITLVSRQNGAAGAGANGNSGNPAVSGDGRLVAFESDASNLSDEDSDNVQDIFVRDLKTNTTRFASRATGVDGAAGDGFSTEASISSDGRYVAFESEANSFTTDHVPGENIYLRDLQARTTALISRASGIAGAGAQGDSFHAAVSADGRFVAFDSGSDNLSAEDDDLFEDVFVRDLRGDPPVVPRPAPPLDRTPPALSARALARANRAVRVRSRGRFRLFCGRYSEPVTGTCAVRRPKRFATAAGRRVMVRFRLARTTLRKLVARHRLRLHATVVARDAAGNAATVRFRVRLIRPRCAAGCARGARRAASPW